MIFIAAFLATLLISSVATLGLRKIAPRVGALDIPRADITRKIHKQPMPLLGGLAVIGSFIIVSGLLYIASPLLRNNIPLGAMLALWGGSVILAIGGAWDDIRDLPPLKQILFPITAALLVIFSGIQIPHLTNPFGGRILLEGATIAGISVLSAAVVFLWIMGMIYTTKFLDGLDGLASTIGLVGALVLFALSFTPQVNQPYTALLAIVVAGALAGFLIFNWHPAKIFLGESGSTFVGFVLAVLSVIAGAKIATAFLVMGVPILDVAWVIARRLRSKSSPFKADRLHLHFRLLDLGLTQRQTVGIFVAFSVIFGGLAVALQSMGKLLVLLAMVVMMIALGVVLFYLGRRRVVAAINPSKEI